MTPLSVDTIFFFSFVQVSAYIISLSHPGLFIYVGWRKFDEVAARLFSVGGSLDLVL